MKINILSLDFINHIPDTGYFLILKDQSHSSDERRVKGEKLHIFKQKKEADKAYSIYVKCFNNAISLLRDARILFENSCFPRSVALAILAYEELGKSQAAADNWSGVITDLEYKNIFRNHRKKTSFSAMHMGISPSGKENSESRLLTDDNLGELIEIVRQKALYADENSDPDGLFTKDYAERFIEKIAKQIEYIRFAEAVNERIGSKALFK